MVSRYIYIKLLGGDIAELLKEDASVLNGLKVVHLYIYIYIKLFVCRSDNKSWNTFTNLLKILNWVNG